MVTHVVQKGETLGKIAQRYNVTINAIKDANNETIKDVNKIGIGWKLKIPVDASKNYYTIGKALETCLNDIKNLDSYKVLKGLL